MSSVFSKPKVVQIEPEEVEPEVVDNSEEVQELERKRKRKWVRCRSFCRTIIPTVPAARPRSALNDAGGGSRMEMRCERQAMVRDCAGG